MVAKTAAGGAGAATKGARVSMYAFQETVSPVLDREALQINADVGQVAGVMGVSTKEAQEALTILSVLAEYDRQIAVLQEQIAALGRQPQCCGWLEERDNGSVLAVHAVRDNCPFSGHEARPGQNRGLRVYVRQDDREAMRQAQERYSQAQNLLREVEKLQRGRRSVADKLRQGRETAIAAVK